MVTISFRVMSTLALQVRREWILPNSIRTPDFRFLQWENPSNQDTPIFEELYDHSTDDLEQKNIANDENFAERIQNLRLQLQKNLN